MGWSQIFLKVSFEKAGNIDGECEIAAYEKQIVLLDFDWSLGVASDVIKGKGADRQITRRLDASPLKLSKRFDLSSTSLFNAMATRDRIKTARITVAQSFAIQGVATLRDAFVIEVQDAYLESIDLDMVSDGKAMVLQEDISIRYSKIKVEVTPVARDGSYSKVKSTFMADLKDSIDLTE